MLTQVVFRDFPGLEEQQKEFHQRDKRWLDCLTPQQRGVLGMGSLTSRSDTNNTIEVFFSYAPEDEALRNELAKQLKLMERQGLIKGWYASDISAGIEKQKEAKEHLGMARIILLLVSPDFMISDYHYDFEMKQALERHNEDKARVIPIILRPTEGWEKTDFGKLQALPRNNKPIINWKNRDEAFYEVAKEIRRVVEQLTHPR